MGRTAPLIAAGVVAALVLANVALVISTRGQVAALRDEVRGLAGPGEAGPALARADLEALRSGLETQIRTEHAALRSGLEGALPAAVGKAVGERLARLPRSSAAAPAPAGDPLEAEAKAFFERQFDSFFSEDYETIVTVARQGADRYAKTPYADRLGKLVERAGRMRFEREQQERHRRARLLAAEAKSERAFARVEDAYMNLIIRDPVNPMYHREVAEFYLRVGKHREAETEFGNVITVTHKEPFGYIARGKLRENLGRLEEATKDYEYALRAHPDNVEAKERLDAVNAKLGAGAGE